MKEINFLRREFCRCGHTDQQYFVDHKMKAKEMANFIDWIRTDILLCEKNWNGFSAEVTQNMQKINLRFYNNVVKFS